MRRAVLALLMSVAPVLATAEDARELAEMLDTLAERLARTTGAERKAA